VILDRILVTGGAVSALLDDPRLAALVDSLTGRPTWLTLALGEVHRRLDDDVAEEIARRLASHTLDALRLQAEGAAALRLCRHADLRRAVERRNADLAAERRGGDGNGHLAMQVVVVAREHRMRLDVHLHVEIARRAAVDAGLAFSGEAHAVAFVDAGRDFH